MDDYISTFPGNSYDWLVTVRASFTLNKAVWSSGMIPALGAGGPRFNSWLSPFLYNLRNITFFSGVFGNLLIQFKREKKIEILKIT